MISIIAIGSLAVEAVKKLDKINYEIISLPNEINDECIKTMANEHVVIVSDILEASNEALVSLIKSLKEKGKTVDVILENLSESLKNEISSVGETTISNIRAIASSTKIVSSERVYQVIDKSMELREYVQVLEDYLFVEITRKLRM